MTDIARMRPLRLALPRGSCDSHCHVFGPADRFPYAPERRFTPEDSPKEALAALHRHLGIDRAVIVQASCHGTDNRIVLDAIAADPVNRRGVASVDAGFSDQTYQTLHDGGIRGVRFTFVRQLGRTPDLALLGSLADRIKAFGDWHVVLHVDAADLDDLAPTLRALPVPFVIDHMAYVSPAGGLEQPALRALLALAQCEHGWIKVSGASRVALPPYADAAPIARAVIAAAPDRVLWGSDFPHANAGHVCDDVALVEVLEAFAPDPDQRRRLLVDNPARLYGLPPVPPSAQ